MAIHWERPWSKAARLGFDLRHGGPQIRGPERAGRRHTLMAYAATHEIGHLLLGPNHSPSGIVRAVWGETEYRSMAHRWLDSRAAEQQALWPEVPTPNQLLAGLK